MTENIVKCGKVTLCNNDYEITPVNDYEIDPILHNGIQMSVL